jgi:hypothetical protein
MKKILGLLIFLPLTFISCKKDKLKGDKDVFIGNGRIPIMTMDGVKT